MNRIVLTIIIALLIIPIGIAQEEITFNEDEVKTWHKNWEQIKSKARSNLEGVNQDWTSASEEDRQNTINDLINKDNTIETKGFESSQLKLNDEGQLTNGKANFDPEKLPEGTTSIEYAESENAFIYRFGDKFVKIRNGQLNPDLTITGTGWPSDGLKWNKDGAFNQDMTGVILEGNAEIDVGRMHISKLLNDKPSHISFREGDSGKEYIKGTNIKVDVKDLAVIRIPKKETEVFIGEKQPSLPNQHIKISPDGSTIDANADDVQIDLLPKLNTVNANGNNIVIKNKDLIIRIKDDANGESQVYINKPGEAYEVDINNKRNENEKVTIEEGLDKEIEETENQIEENNQKIEENRGNKENTRILTENGGILEDRKKQQIEADRTESDSGRIKYTWSRGGHLGPQKIIKRTQHAMDAEFIISDQDRSQYGNNLGAVPDESPKKIDLISRLNIGGLMAGIGGRSNLPGGGLHITRNDLIGELPSEVPRALVQKIFPSSKRVYSPGEAIRFISGGKGSGTAGVQVFGYKNNQLTKISDLVLSGQEADILINYINNEYRKKY